MLNRFAEEEFPVFSGKMREMKMDIGPYSDHLQIAKFHYSLFYFLKAHDKSRSVHELYQAFITTNVIYANHIESVITFHSADFSRFW